MNDYQPKHATKQKAEQNGEPIPVVYILRKPHPNGLLEYLLVTYVNHPKKRNKKLPYILDIIPHVKAGDSSPTEAVKEFMKRYLKIY